MNSGDLLVISHLANLVMKGFHTAYTLNTDANGNKWDDLTTYIKADVVKFQVPDTGETCWIISGHTSSKRQSRT